MGDGFFERMSMDKELAAKLIYFLQCLRINTFPGTPMEESIRLLVEELEKITVDKDE